MDRFGPPTWYAGWRRGPALAVLALLAAALLAACWPVSASPAPKVRASVAEQSDLDLYRGVIARVRAGDAYYPAVAEELRKDDYPLRPFITFRLPTQAYAYAWLGEPVMIGLQILLALAVGALWWRRLGSDAPLWLRAVALFFLAAGMGGLVEPVTGLFHESWAALLMALALALRRPGHAAGAIVAAGIALLVRETALPMLAMMGVLASLEKRWREAVGWAAAIALFAFYLTWHAAQVAAVVTAADPASPGWQAMLGARFALKAQAAVNAATILPYGLAAAALILSLFGWASVRAGWAVRVALLLIGYGAMLALFARADTFYWALLVTPLSLMGIAFVPAALRDLAAALDLAPRRVASVAP